MTTRRLVLSSPIVDSYRVARVLGALDKPDLREVTTTLEFEEPPGLEEDWSIGLIVGPSGSGKTTIARELYGAALDAPPSWDARAVVDNFAPRPFDDLAQALTAVGFASQTRWLRPYATLSAGERFRCDLARVLFDAEAPVVVFDEFASLVDKTCAQTVSAALRKAYDKNAFRPKFVALSHRGDVAEYLEPDWTLNAQTGVLTRGRLRRRKFAVDVVSVPRAVWARFKEFHYLSGALNFASKCYAAALREPGANEDSPPALAAFAAILQAEGRPGCKRVHRLVVRPEFQGLGLGGAFLDALGELTADDGCKLEIVTGSAALLRRLQRSPKWRLRRAYPHGRTQRHKGVEERGSLGRAIVSFEYKNVLTKEK